MNASERQSTAIPSDVFPRRYADTPSRRHVLYLSAITGRGVSFQVDNPRGGRYWFCFMGDPPEDLPSAPRWARLELVTEGATHFCTDGSVLGSQGNLPETLTQHWTDLEPRHLLLGRESGFWFVFTPATVTRPFWLDGTPLLSGERRRLDRVRHHLALDDLRIGLRLHPTDDGWLSRLRGRG